MTKVYIVRRYVEWESNDVVAVFVSLPIARRYAKKLTADERQRDTSYTVEKWDVATAMPTTDASASITRFCTEIPLDPTPRGAS